MADKTLSQVNFASGLQTKVRTDDVTATPTDAEFDTAFGTPAQVGAGFIGILNDAGGGTAVYLVYSDGASWFYVAGTKAL